MEPPVELVSFVTRAENRVTVLRTLSRGPATRRALQDETDIPRATLSRILADFRDRELAVREGHDYATTPLGDVLAAELQTLIDAVAGMGAIQTLHQWLDVDEHDVPIDRLADAEVVLPSPIDPLAPIRRAEQRLANGAEVRLAGRGVVPSCLDAVWRAVTEGGQRFEAVVSSDTLETMAADQTMRRQALDLVDAESASLAVHPGELLPFLFVVDDLVWIAVADDAGPIQGHIETTDERVRAWAEDRIDGYLREAEPVSPDVLTA